MSQNEHALPEPHELLELAELEEIKINLVDYVDAILTLKEKNWAYRDIASWLTKKGVTCTHMQVYRFYKKWGEHQEAICIAKAEGDFDLADKLSEDFNG